MISSPNPLDLYLSEMGAEPLLTHEQEIALAKRIQAGTESDDPDVQADAEAARKHMARANTRLVVNIAKKYRNRGLQFSDLIQEGNIGLLKAVDRYDHSKGFRFSTYATYWIHQAIGRATVNKGRTIRLPVHLNTRLRKLRNASNHLQQRLQRPPTPEELGEELSMSASDVQDLLIWRSQPLSLEDRIGPDGDTERGELIADEQAESPQEEIVDMMLADDVQALLAEQLTPREARIVKLRYGLAGNEPLTLKEIGRRFGLSRERIRQIERRALRRLREPENNRRLGAYAR